MDNLKTELHQANYRYTQTTALLANARTKLAEAIATLRMFKRMSYRGTISNRTYQIMKMESKQNRKDLELACVQAFGLQHEAHKNKEKARGVFAAAKAKQESEKYTQSITRGRILMRDLNNGQIEDIKNYLKARGLY